MKKILLPLAALTMIIGATLLTSCTQDDTTAPVITLTGDNPQILHIGEAYTELGATANDSKDGDLTSSIVIDHSAVNVNLKGTYTVNYTVSDAAGNAGTKTRTVNVVNSAENLAGTYNVTDLVAGTSYPYVDNITTSSTVNNRIWVTKFAAYNNAAVYFDVSGTTIDLPTQMVTGVGSPAADRTFAGSGSITGTTIAITYTETVSGTPPVTGVETYTKQ